MLMPCRYQAVFAVHSINKPPDGGQELCVDKVNALRMSIVASPDALLSNADRGNAIGTVFLKKAFQGAEGTFDELLAAETRAISSRRTAAAGSSAFVVVTVDSEVEANLDGEGREHGDFRIIFDAIHKEPTRQSARRLADRALAAPLLGTEMEPKCDRLGECVYLLPKEGGVIYSLSFSGSANATVSRNLSPEEIDRVRSFFGAIDRGPDLGTVFSLLRAATDASTEPLRRYLAAWCAIEIFTNKVFSEQGQRWLADPQTASDQLRSDHVRGSIESKQAKFPLLDRFAVTVDMLDAPDASVDIDTFKNLKELRDRLLHGGVKDTASLPVGSLVALTRKLLRLHFARPAVA